jgi:hypothetical protein
VSSPSRVEDIIDQCSVKSQTNRIPSYTSVNTSNLTDIFFFTFHTHKRKDQDYCHYLFNQRQDYRKMNSLAIYFSNHKSGCSLTPQQTITKKVFYLYYTELLRDICQTSYCAHSRYSRISTHNCSGTVVPVNLLTSWICHQIRQIIIGGTYFIWQVIEGCHKFVFCY